MKKVSLAVCICVALLGLAGCKRGVCEPAHESAKVAPMEEPWTSKKDLLPASATVCGHVVVDGKVKRDGLAIDFADDPNPWVTIVDHLEKKGYERSSQSIDNPDTQMATLHKEDETIQVSTFRDGGRVRAMLKLESAACRMVRKGSEGTGCRGNEIVTCDPETGLVSGVKEKCSGKCVASMSAPAACK
jgi:hypothetical protein